MRVLVVEDEPFLAESIATQLKRAGMSVDLAADGDTALELSDLNPYRVILLDRDLPGTHGDDVCRQLTSRPQRPAILMLTAAGRLGDTVEGLRLGADDYLAKPFEFPELIARVVALGRREFSTPPPRLTRGGIVLDPFRREITREGLDVSLSRKEFAVLEVLMRAAGGVVSAEDLLEQAWDEHANPFTNSVKVTISSLRRKLGEPWLIRTVPGSGYVLDE